MSNLFWVAIGVQAYTLAYLLAAVTVSRTRGGVLSPFNFLAIGQESVGAAVRLMNSRTTLTSYTSRESLFRMYGLDPATATEAQLLDAYRGANDYLLETRWAYPRSQREILSQLTVAAVEYVRLRDRIAESARRSQTPGPPRKPASTWRRVLGLSSAEKNPDVIRRAYRKLVSKAHPDKGGNASDMAALGTAMQEARDELNFV